MIKCLVCGLTLFLVITATFVLFLAPWMAAVGPWVNYYVDVDRIPNDTDTAELYLQYPMLMFERQQYLVEMCFPRMSTPVWQRVFNLPVQTRYEYNEDGTISSQKDWYCMSEWNITINNETREVFYVSVSMGNAHHLLVADSYWFLWGATFIFLMSCCPGICSTRRSVGVFIFFVAVARSFAARIALSVSAMLEFYRYDALTDPPHWAYIRNTSILEGFTTRSYGYGFVTAWMVIAGHAPTAIAIFCFCTGGCLELMDSFEKVRTRVMGIRKKSTQSTAPDACAATAGAAATTTEGFTEPPADAGALGTCISMSEIG